MQPADRNRFAQLGTVAIIAKPFKTMLLADRVAEILGWED